MMFTLYNKELKRFLKHPKDGIWTSDNIEEAQKLLQSAQEYVRAVGISELADKLIIMTIDAHHLGDRINPI